jgi:hypothetical protein
MLDYVQHDWAFYFLEPSYAIHIMHKLHNYGCAKALQMPFSLTGIELMEYRYTPGTNWGLFVA